MSIARQELHRVVDMLNDDDTETFLKLIKRIVYLEDMEDNEPLSEEELEGIRLSREDIKNGDYIYLDELEQERL